MSHKNHLVKIEKTTCTTTVYITQELRERMLRAQAKMKAKGYEISWSRIAREAFEQALKNLE